MIVRHESNAIIRKKCLRFCMMFCLRYSYVFDEIDLYFQLSKDYKNTIITNEKNVANDGVKFSVR